MTALHSPTPSPRSRCRAVDRLYPLAAVFAMIAALVMLAAPVQAAPEPAFQAAFSAFQQAVATKGEGGSAAAAAEQFDALLKAEPGNPLLMAYSGAATAMLANTTMLPWKKMSYAEDGLAQIDKGLAMLQPVHDAPMQRGTPGSLETRFVAASTFLKMPPMMNRGARGEKLLAEVQASPLMAQAPLGFKGAVWMAAARHAQDEKQGDEARRLYAQVIASNAPQAEQAQAQLKSLAK